MKKVITLVFAVVVGLVTLLSCSSNNKPDKTIEISVNNRKIKSYEFNGEVTIPLETVCNILGYHNRKYVQEGNEKIFVASKNNYMYFYKGENYFSSRPKKLNGVYKEESSNIIEESYNKVNYKDEAVAVSYGGTLYIPISIVDSSECLEVMVRYIDDGYRLGEYYQVK